jgi:hypothetical protein
MLNYTCALFNDFPAFAIKNGRMVIRLFLLSLDYQQVFPQAFFTDGTRRKTGYFSNFCSHIFPY